MDQQQLDDFLRSLTAREQFYLEHPGARSPIYQISRQEVLHGHIAYIF